MAKADLKTAKVGKNDEFYTQLPDIEKELRHYKEHFKDKVVFCNCDDPYESNFFKYFALNFNKLGLKRLIATCYNGSPVSGNELLLDFGDTVDDPKKIAYKVEITEVGDENGDGAINLVDIQHLMQYDKNVISVLKGNGDFRSEECIELLKQADIVVTNPPFSLFREYVAQLVKFEKKFLILGNMNAITYKEIFALIKENKMWIGNGFNLSMVFKTTYPNKLEANRQYVRNKGYNPDENYVKTPAIAWFTNLDIQKRHEDLILYKYYTPEEYPYYDNYDAINVNSITEIPQDYYDLMGVPITFMDKYNPEQFEIVTLGVGEDNFTPTKKYGKFRNPETGEYCSDKRDFLLYIKDKNGKYLTEEGYRVTKLYARILIRRKK
ncbi:MAG: adenine-specific methyltransferase EcoRI family protein [Paludibacteraceae bacterium]|nr:adenine-specific methyltransferase EcoRI family protein [Paludibacteraceae bacterium]